MRARRWARLACSSPSRSRALALLVGQQVEVGLDALAQSAGRGLAAARRAWSSSAIHGALGEAVGDRRRGRAPRRRRAAPGRRPSASASARSASPRAQARAGLRGRPAPTPWRAEPLGDRGCARRVEAHVLAAAGDRRQHVGRPAGQQHEVGERRRLLERLEHPVGRLVVELVGALDDEHAPARLERRARRRRRRPASSTSPTSIPALELGVTHVRSGCDAGLRRAARRCRGRRRPRPAAPRRTRRATSRLPAAGGAVEEVGVAGRPRRRQRGAQDGAGVRMVLGARRARASSEGT